LRRSKLELWSGVSRAKHASASENPLGRVFTMLKDAARLIARLHHAKSRNARGIRFLGFLFGQTERPGKAHAFPVFALKEIPSNSSAMLSVLGPRRAVLYRSKKSTDAAATSWGDRCARPDRVIFGRILSPPFSGISVPLARKFSWLALESRHLFFVRYDPCRFRTECERWSAGGVAVASIKTR